jgi:cobalt-zinc-cadmium efflux system outer membrane protein
VKRIAIELSLVLALTAFAPSLRAQGDSKHRHSGEAAAAGPSPSAQAAAVPPLRLEDLEQMALEHNPALGEAQARVRAVRGLKRQAGLYPNPLVGYTGDEISTGPFRRGGEQGFFVEQEIPTAGKLRLGRSVFGEQERQAAAAAEAEKLRTLNAVRGLYYQALGAEKLVAVRTQLAGITHEAAEVSRQLANVGQADQPDVLEAEVEDQRAALALEAAQNDRERIWRQLGAAVGVSALRPAPLAGSLEEPAPELEFDRALESVLHDSPEVNAAEAGVARAQQAEERARAERIPNLLVRGGLRDNRELLEATGKPVGLEGFAEVGVRILLFDRNQGGIAAARAEQERAQLEVARVKLALRARLAAAFRSYSDARALVARYRDQMLPRAQKAYELYLASYKQMAAAYPQVLIAQRNLAQLQLDYLAAEQALWQSVVEIRGMLLAGGVGAAEISDAGAGPVSLREDSEQDAP